MKALIIDDEIDICYLLSSILKQQHIETRYVNALADATNALAEGAPELVFLDNHLPDGLGVDFIQHIKRLYPTTKVVMITAYDTAADRVLAVQKGVDIFLGKPFTKEAIVKVIDTLHISN